MDDQPPPPAPWTNGGALQPGPHPTSEERNWAVAAHLGSLVAAYLALGLLGPLVVLLVKGNDSAYVRRQAVESLNFQVSVLIYAIAGTVLAIVLTVASLGFALIVIVPLAIVLAVVYLVLIIVATVKAAQGEDYRYPLTLRLVS